jgi:type I restriction enzyme S subunit
VSVSFSPIKDIAISANTGLDAIKRAPIVDFDTGIKCLRIQDVSQSKAFSNWGFTDVEERNYKKFQLKENDILIARTGASIGVNRFISEDAQAVFNNGLIRIRVDTKKCFPKYLFYNFRTTDYQGFIESISGGTSTQPNMQIGALLSFEVYLPEIEEQKAIASVLSSLDDKIDLLHRQNTTLEAMAETLFRQWFVEEAHVDWEEVPLKDVVDIAIGRTPPRQEHQWFSESEIDVKWISIKDMGNDGVYIFKTSEYLTKEAVRLFNIPVIPKGTVVLSFKMTLGRVAITTQEMLSNEAIAHFKFTSKTPFIKEYLFLFLKTFKWDLLGSTSSIVTSINSAMIKDMEIAIPDIETMNKFKEVSESLFDKVKSNQQQIQTLEKLRDNLLPKLMSGEVRIQDA